MPGLCFLLVAGSGGAAAAMHATQQTLLLMPGRTIVHRSACRTSTPQLLEPPFPHWFYDKQPEQKKYSDYVWDPDFPGTLKPGLKDEQYTLDEVFEMWEGKENPNVMEYPQDEVIQLPLKPPEDILAWLERRGLLDTVSDDDEDEMTASDTLLDDEFDLDDSDDDSVDSFSSGASLLGEPKDMGATMSDFL